MADQNAGRGKNGRRYEQSIKLMAVYLYIIGGNKTFETLAANLEGSLPSLSLVKQIARNYNAPIKEGVLRMAECRTAVTERKQPRTVWVCEDSTCINGRVEHDAKDDRCVGFVGPLDDNGVPDISGFAALDAETIQKLFSTHAIARNAHLVIAQPLQKHAAPCWLLLFGTDNKYPKEAVIRRWRYIKAEAEKNDVEILGFSSDGDPRYLSAMKWKCFRPNPGNGPDWSDWFAAKLEMRTLFVQDTVHVLTKMRNRLLKPSVHLPMGQYIVSEAHLRHVVDTGNPLEHKLTMTDINNKDKMNFRAVTRMTSDAVLQCVRRQGDSEGTQAFLQIMRDVMDSYLKENISPDHRVFLIWRAVFFLRIWRKWLLNEEHAVADSFITWNAYVCIEINAHTLVIAIRRLRTEGRPELFLPRLFSSQPCEEAFRDARSQSTTNETVVNFSMKGMLQRGGRIELQGAIAHQLGEEFEFPRDTRRQAAAQECAQAQQEAGLPSDEVILGRIAEARQSAFQLAQWLGMEVGDDATVFPSCLTTAHLDTHLDDSDEDENTPVNIEDSVPDPEDLDPYDVAVLELAETSQSVQEEPNRAPPPPKHSVRFTTASGVQVMVRKSTLCWRLGDQPKMSADRLLRVQQGRAVEPQSRSVPAATARTVERAGTIHVLQWCAFRRRPGKVLIGRVLGFRYLSGATEKSRQFGQEYVNTDSTKVGVIASWFDVQPGGSLKYVPSDQKVEPVNNYHCTIPPPTFNGSSLALDEFILKCIM